ncbi:hypothetical protein ACGFZB_06030 [Streptomyces cinerochromogenes]|uniref:Uncharacterized protein n=1 Tax=Streptomyces cinerochromogenes TaxID=66422 RepID=A0ABW7B2S3_9ACTN
MRRCQPWSRAKSSGAPRGVSPQPLQGGGQALGAGGAEGRRQGAAVLGRAVPDRGHRPVAPASRNLVPRHGREPAPQVVRRRPGVRHAVAASIATSASIAVAVAVWRQ